MIDHRYDRRDPRVYHRDRDLPALLSRLERALHGEGGTVFIAGETGIGKSELLEDLERGAGSTSWLRVCCSPGIRSRVRCPIATALSELLSSGPARAAEPPSDREPSPPDGPRLFLVEDVHYLPEEGARRLGILAESVADRSALLAATTLPSAVPGWACGDDALTGCEVLRLRQPETSALEGRVRAGLGSTYWHRLVHHVARILISRGGHNVLFGIEGLRHLLDTYTVRADEYGIFWTTEKEHFTARVPGSLPELIRARIKCLDARDRRVLEAAACWDREVDPALLAAVLETSAEEVEKGLQAIAEGCRHVERRGDGYVFSHPFVQEMFIEGIDEAEREGRYESYRRGCASGLGTGES